MNFYSFAWIQVAEVEIGDGVTFRGAVDLNNHLLPLVSSAGQNVLLYGWGMLQPLIVAE